MAVDRARRRAAHVLGSLVAVAALVGACSSGGGDTARSAGVAGAASDDTTTTQPAHEVALVEEAFVDQARQRSLPTRIHYPSDARDPFPLVVLSHGFTGRAANYTRLATEIARAGYVVAAPTFPLTNGGVPSPEITDVENQPADVSFVLDELLRLSTTDGHVLEGRIDADRIGAAGHSLGAVTTLLVTSHACCADDRFDAAVALAGAAVFAPSGSGAFFDGVGPPILFVHGDDDRVVGLPLGRLAFRQAASPKFFVTLLGGDHASPFLIPTEWERVVGASMVAFFDEYLAGRDGALDRLAAVASVEGTSTFEGIP